MSATVPDWFLPSVAAILPRAPSSGDLKCSVVLGGGNNRVFRVQHAEDSYFVKWYFTDLEDLRDRRDAEWKFSSFAWAQGLRSLAKPVGSDAEHGLSVFEFVEGRSLTPPEIAKSHVRAAVDFLLELNRHRDLPAAKELPNASEACFSINGHVDCIKRRVHRLQEGSESADFPDEARDFIQQTLAANWMHAETQVRTRFANDESAFSAELPNSGRILSPSDFGFHNALLNSEGRLRFYDFEYAGWDDPAKTVCDFFSQVQVPVPEQYRSEFIEIIASLESSGMAERCELLRPLYCIKWACIVLNPLLRAGRERRQFSGGKDAWITDSECLERARKVLSSI